MKEENTIKSDVIDTLENVIDALKDFSSCEHPIAFGVRVGLIAAKELIENAEDSK